VVGSEMNLFGQDMMTTLYTIGSIDTVLLLISA
jgi:hypothetical protein